MVVTCPCATWVNVDRRIRFSFQSSGLLVTKELRWIRVSCTVSSQQDAKAQAQIEQTHEEKEEERIMCEACKGTGWLICDFCEGQKTNIQTKNNRIYRRCPTCKAVGCVLCPKCKVYKCVTFPDFFDEE